MSGNNEYTHILNQLNSWIAQLRYNPVNKQWEGKLKPRGIIITFSLSEFVYALERHVVRELIAICADVLRVDVDRIAGTRERSIVDLKHVVAYLVATHFPSIRQNSINDLLGWRNRCSMSHSLQQCEVIEVRNKIEKVYKAYPDLRTGVVEIEPEYNAL